MTTEERLDRLTGIVEALAASVVEHDNQLGLLIQIVDKNSAQIEETRLAIASLERQWQA